MITDAGLIHLTPAELFEHLGVTVTPIGDDLDVRFANGQREHFIPAPDDFKRNGDSVFITHNGRAFIPLDEDDR